MIFDNYFTCIGGLLGLWSGLSLIDFKTKIILLYEYLVERIIIKKLINLIYLTVFKNFIELIKSLKRNLKVRIILKFQ